VTDITVWRVSAEGAETRPSDRASSRENNGGGLVVDAASLTAEDIRITRRRGAPIPGYLAKPAAAGRAPGVLVIHEAYGLNDNIRDITERFARAGYVALAVDLFADGNRTLCMVRVMGEALLRPLGNSGLRVLRTSVAWPRRHPDVDGARTAVIGFCMGGGFALALARVDDGLRAAASFYGGNPRPLSAVARACPITGSYPGNDPFTRGGTVKLDAALSRYGVPHDIEIHPGARHSFCNDRGRAYHPDAARDAWERTLGWFHEYLDADAGAPPSG
jgi:carboxymethylenebutenolidase